ncbi:MAG: YgjP-like metallopeptidase domain-containing protein [Microgenomates group bacterium]
MDYTLIRAHKRTLSLQVSKDGVLIARAPYLMPKFLIDRFVNEKSRWVAKRIKEMQKPVSPKVEHFTEDELKLFIHKQLTKYSKLMGLKHAGVRFTRVKTYWGTCAPSGILSFNLALCYAEPDAVSYVVVHELAHLRWKGHGKRFWDMVNKYYPKSNEMRSLLRHIRHGE